MAGVHACALPFSYPLVATKVVYDQFNDIFTANGSLELREPNGNILQAQTAELRNKLTAGFTRHRKALLTNDRNITTRKGKRASEGQTGHRQGKA